MYVRRGIGELSANGPHRREESQMIGKAAAARLGSYEGQKDRLQRYKKERWKEAFM